MLREILQIAVPVMAFVGASVVIARSGGFPLWKTMLGGGILVAVSMGLAILLQWLY